MKKKCSYLLFIACHYFIFLLLHLHVGCAPSEIKNYNLLCREIKCFRKVFPISFLQCPPEDVLSGSRSSWCNSNSSLKVPCGPFCCVHGTSTCLLLDFLPPQLPPKRSRFLFERELCVLSERKIQIGHSTINTPLANLSGFRQQENEFLAFANTSPDKCVH